MLELLYKLTALGVYCKDAHYSFNGVNFKPLHEWADEISDPIYDWLDELKEHYYLFQGLAVPRGVDINDGAKDYVPVGLSSNEEILSNILAVLSMVHADITKLNASEQDKVGLCDVFSKIDNHVMKHIGLLNLALIERKNND